MARLMALDVGEARIGVAVCDAREVLASPYTTLHVTRDETQTFAAIRRLIDETEAEGLVVGLPISMDGQIHGQGKWVQEFVERLKPSLYSLPLIFWDERLSTVEARRMLNQDDTWGEDIGRTRQRRRRSSKRRLHTQEIDAYAAAVILQDYLDSRARNVEGTT
jgi:putative Holliday junction resolvase